MRAPPSFFGYLIFVALVLASSACNSGDVMTLPLHYPACVVGGSSFSLLSLYLVSLGTNPGFSKQNSMSIDFPWAVYGLVTNSALFEAS